MPFVSVDSFNSPTYNPINSYWQVRGMNALTELPSVVWTDLYTNTAAVSIPPTSLTSHDSPHTFALGSRLPPPSTIVTTTSPHPSPRSWIVKWSTIETMHTRSFKISCTSINTKAPTKWFFPTASNNLDLRTSDTLRRPYEDPRYPAFIPFLIHASHLWRADALCYSVRNASSLPNPLDCNKTWNAIHPASFLSTSPPI